MTYRLGFRFEPQVERLSGRAKGGTLYATKRGAWRVVKLIEPGIDLTPVFTADGTLYVLSPEPIHPGAFKSPRDVLDNYFNQTRNA